MKFFSHRTRDPRVYSLRQAGSAIRRSSCYVAGVTLIESIVSITLLSIAIAGPITLAAHSIKASGAARSEMIATHLVEEGLEVVHSMRDNNSADDTNSDGRDWMKWISSCDDDCIIDVTEHAADVWDNQNVLKCTGGCGDKAIMYVNPNTGLYRQSNDALASPWVKTAFRRTISITNIDNLGNPQRQVRVTATVTYPGYGGAARTISISQDLFNWFPQL